MKISGLQRVALLVVPIIAVGFVPAVAAPALTSSAIRTVFASIAQSSSLANPSMILIDRANGEVVYEKDATSLRKPASVMKLLAATATLEYLDPKYQYVTKALLGSKPDTIILSGKFDPWMTARYREALTDHRAWLNYLANKAIVELKAQKRAKVTHLKIEYYGLYPNDIADIRSYLKGKGISTTATSVTINQVATSGNVEIASVTSPTIGDMLKFALLWSDNLLAERLARAAARAAGFAMNDVGVSNTFRAILTNFQLDHTGFYTRDGNGLSKDDRVTAKLIGELLLKVRGNEKFASLYGYLPVAGVSGTLENRFIKTAPQAVGLVHAKTGTLSGTVSLAGYVESGQHEYVFVVLADRIPKGYIAGTRARNALDRILGKIAAPLIPAPLVVPAQTPVPQETMEATS